MLFAMKTASRKGVEYLREFDDKTGWFATTPDVRLARKWTTTADLVLFADDRRIKNYEAVAVTPEMMEASSS